MNRISALRNILTGKPVRALLVAAMTVPGLLLAASPGASARVGQHLCETFGSFCVGGSAVGLDNPVVETTDGRLLNFNSAGSGVEMQLVANASLCVAAANNGHDVVMHPCNGGHGVIWHEQQGPASTLFENNEFSGKYLSGANNGTQFQIKDRGASGWEQQFSAGA